jgi:hypothetical protein
MKNIVDFAATKPQYLVSKLLVAQLIAAAEQLGLEQIPTEDSLNGNEEESQKGSQEEKEVVLLRPLQGRLKSQKGSRQSEGLF